MQVLVLTPKAALALCLRMQVLLVPPDTKISTVKETWGKQEGFTKLTQPQVRDEFGYVVGSSDMDKPLTNFSNKCNLNLDFTHPQFIGKV
eukprot:m.235850 g.235850  ORF g.235850 m.235850 type:complete len:90 (-) comp26162_c1_seq12:1774-2043(-)